MSAEMSPVELLRAAAARLRETAEGTTTPPWYEDSIDGVYAYGAPGEDCPSVFTDGRVRYQDVCWIVLVHPGLAEPLAALLEEALPYARLPRWETFPVAVRAVALARVLLGVVPDGR